MHKVLRLPRKSERAPAATKRAPASPRQSKCCACHAKVLPDAQSAALATDKRPGPRGDQTRAGKSQRLKVLRLPRKSSARCTKCCACHAKAAGPPRRPNARRQLPESQSVAPATQKSLQLHKVLRLPPKSSARCAKCCACHAKAAGPSRRPNARRNSQRVKVLRLPRKSSARCTKCCACHAKAAGPPRRPK